MTSLKRQSINERLTRATVFCLLVLATVLLPAHEARAQWTTNGADINNTNSGNVGIGTPTPENSEGWSKVLDVLGGAHTKLSIRTSTIDGRVLSHSTGWWSAPAGMMVGTHSSHPLSFATAGTSRMTIGNTGNVGIGTNSPTSMLDVLGNAGTPFRVRDTSGYEYLSASMRVGTYGRTPVMTLAGGRLVVDSDGPDGDNNTILRRLVNSMIINPSDHPYLKGGLMVRQAGGTFGLYVDQNANGNVGIGTHVPTAKLHVAGNVVVDGNISAKYQDVAEWVPSAQKLSAGTVVILDIKQDNHVTASQKSYDTRVAGVVSAQPGLSLGEAGEGKALVATTGRVKVKVDATRAPISVGDLLVTSDTPGVAMRSEPLDLGGVPIHRPGTLIGKALQALDKGTGEILVLLSLQ